MYNAVINFVDVGNIRTRAVIQNIPDASAPTTLKLATFITAYHAHQFPGVESYSLLQWTEGEVTGSVTTAVGTNCEKAQINYRYVDAADNTQYGTLWLPNPDMTHFEFVEGVGYRMLPASLELLATALSGASGLIIDVLEGKLEYKTKSYGNGARNASCLRFTDSIENVDYMSFPLVTDSAALIDLGIALNTDTFTQSVLDRSYYLSQTDVMTDPTTAPGLAAAGEWDSVESRAYLKFVYMEGTKRKFMQLMVPGIKKTACFLKSGTSGYKVSKVTGDGIALALTGFFGAGTRTLRFFGSRVDIKDQKNQ